MKDVIIRIKTDDDEIEPTIKKLQRLGLIDEKNAKSFEDTNKKFKNGQLEARSEMEKTSKVVNNLGGIVAGAFTVGALVSFSKAVLNTRAEMQKFEAVLTNTLGSGSKAQKALKDIKDFAAQTPFAVKELTESFVKLANQGFKPTTEQMKKLGDLAASTGKSFDQLAEGIIDAQTGEFERLKEFGIRAQKEGDNVKFTFKGVETQTKFTAEAIREYVLSLGNAQGVSGSMAAISKTLGGQISNLGDAWDNLLNSIGGQSQGIFSAAIGSIKDLVEGFENLIKQPVSDKLEEDRIALNMLAQQITSTNTEQEERNRLIAELQSKYPDFLGNIKQEQINNELLTTRLKAVNEQLINKIIIQKKQEEIDELNNDLAGKKLNAFEQEKKVLEELIKTSEKFGFELLKEGTIAEKVTAAQVELSKQFNEFGLLLDPAKRAAKSLEQEMGFLNNTNRKAGLIEKDLNSLLSDKNSLMKKLGVTIEDEKNGTEGLTEADKKLIDQYNKSKGTHLEYTEANLKIAKTVGDVKTASELLAANIKKVKTELDNQSVSGKINNATMQEYIALLNKAALASLLLEMSQWAAAEPKTMPIKPPDKGYIKELAEKNKKALEFERELNTKKMHEEIKFQQSKTEVAEKAAKERAEEETKKEKETAKAKLEISENTAMAMVGIVVELGNLSKALLQREAEEKLAVIDEQYEAELNLLEAQLEAKTINEKQFAGLKKSLDAGIDEERKKIITEQAKREKAIAVMQATINTAAAVVAALKNPPGPPITIPLAIAVGAMGAAQIATIIAQPIPQFARGGTAPGGLAIVGEEGPELVNLPKGSQVKTASQTTGTLDEIFAQLQTVNSAIKLLVENDNNLILAAFTRGLLGTYKTQINISTLKSMGFKDGTARVTGGTPGKDSVPAMLMPDEAVIKSKENMKYPGLAKAWNEGTLDEFINKKYTMPLLIKGNIKAKHEDEFVDKLTNKLLGSAFGNGFDNYGIIKELKKNNKSQQEMIELLRKRDNGNHRLGS